MAKIIRALVPRQHGLCRLALLIALAAAVVSAPLVGCGGAVSADALAVQPAALPLRAYPRVLIVPGPLKEDGRVARALARQLKSAGHTRVQLIDRARLRAHTQGAAVPAATAVVELLVATQEFVHAQHGRHAETTCDSLGCFQSVPAHARDAAVMRALLQVTVRDARTMRVVQQLNLRALESSGDFEHLRGNAVASLISRLRASTEQLLQWVALDLLPVDVPGVDGAIDAARDGEWAKARVTLERVVRDIDVAAIGRARHARLLFDLGQARRAGGLAGDLEAMRGAERALARARALAPGVGIYSAAHEAVCRDLGAVAEVRAQHIQAARNFRFGGDTPHPGSSKDDSAATAP